MQSTTNVFQGGLTTDLHPLVTANTQLTDALNATFITYNGNEMILQNDMGNTLIQDSTTGAVMGLRDGFIPVGMKEHGGIMYIASYNPKTKESELGSIPSPVFDYTYNMDGSSLLDINKSLFTAGVEAAPAIKLSNERFSTGDVFYLDLDITEGNSTVTRNYTDTEYNPTSKQVNFPSISNGSKGYGLVSLHLLANCDQINKEVDLGVHLADYDSDAEHRWYHRWDMDTSSQQVINTTAISYGNDDSGVDIEQKFNTRQVIHYPNFQTGTLSIKPVLETPSNFEILTNQTSMRPEPYFVIREIERVVFRFENLTPNSIRINKVIIRNTDEEVSVDFLKNTSPSIDVMVRTGSKKIFIEDGTTTPPEVTKVGLSDKLGNKWVSKSHGIHELTVKVSTIYQFKFQDSGDYAGYHVTILN